MALLYTYEQMVTHEGLGRAKIVKAYSQYELDIKVKDLTAQWNRQWERELERRARQEKAKSDEEAKEYALSLTKEADALQASFDSILLNSLSSKETSFDSLRDHSVFMIPRPSSPKYVELPEEPNPSDEKYNSKASFMTRISPKKKRSITKEISICIT